MSERFVHVHEPATGGAPAQIYLRYFARDRAGRSVHLEWPYDGSPASYSYADLNVAPSFVGFHDETSQREWRAVAGEVSLTPLGSGRVRVALEGLAIAEWLGSEEGPAELMENGFVEGDVERVCIEHVPATADVPVDLETGLRPAQRQRDEDWSSAFCAQHAG